LDAPAYLSTRDPYHGAVADRIVAVATILIGSCNDTRKPYKVDAMITEPCCPGRTVTKRISIGGREIGITGLDDVLDAGFRLGLSHETAIRDAMMRELRERNYVPRGAEKEYEDGIWAAFSEVRDRRMKGLSDREPTCRCGETGPGGN